MERVYARILMKVNYGRKKLKQVLKNSTIVWLSQEKVIYLYRKIKGGCRKPHQRVGKKKIRRYEYQKYDPSRKGRMGKGAKRKEIQ